MPQTVLGFVEGYKNKILIENWGITPTSPSHCEELKIVMTDSIEVELEQERAMAFHPCFHFCQSLPSTQQPGPLFM